MGILDAPVPSASTTKQGKIKLAGDLSGTADSPIVVGLSSKQNRTTITIGASADYNYADYATPQAAIQAAIDEYAGTGAALVINQSCTITSSINPKSNLHIEGLPGVVITFNSGHVAGVPTTPNSGFHAFVTTSTISNFSMRNLSFNGGLTTLATGVDGAEYHAIYIKNGSHDFAIENIYGTRTASGVVRFRDTCYSFIGRGITAFEADAAIVCTVGCYKFTLDDIKATDCFAEGLYLGSDIDQFNLSNIHTENCGTRGLSINNDATLLTRGGIRGNVTNVTAINCGLQGVYLTGCDEVNLTNIYARGNQRSGIHIERCNNINLSNSQSWSNNQARATNGTSQYPGVIVYDSKYVKIANQVCDDDGGTIYQYRGIDAQQSVAGATDFVSVIGGRSQNTVSSSQAVIIGNNSTAINHGGYNPQRYKDNGNVSASPSVLLKNGDTQRLVITQDTTLGSLDTNAIPGQLLTLIIVQDATGGHTFTFPSNVSLINGPWTPDTSANAKATITLKFISSSVGWYEVSRSDNTSVSNSASSTAVKTYTVGLTGSGADYIAGATSQQTAFQSAIAAAETLIASNNQAVIIKVLPGLYDQVSNTINLTPKYAHLLYIQGSGRDRTILKKTNSASGGSKIFGYSTPTYSTTPGSDSQDFAYQGGLGFHLSDITLDGNGANQTSGSPISLAGCQDFNLERVKIYDGYQFQSYLKGASGRQILLSDGTTNATVTTVRGSNFVSLTTGTADFTTQVSVGDKLRVATTATPDNTNGSDSDYAFDSADVIAVTATRIQLAAPWPHDSTSGRQARFFKPNGVNSKDLWYENRTGFTATDDSWGGGAFEGQLTNITVKNSGGYGIGMTGSGAFIVNNITIRGGVKGIGMERCYGSTQVSNFDIQKCSSAGLWVVNGNYRTMFSNGVIRACAGNGIDEKVVSVSSDGGFIKSGNAGVIFNNIQIYDCGTHGARITGDGITLRGVKCINNAVSATAAGIVLATDTVGSLTLNAPNVRLIDCDLTETRSSTDRTQDYGLWIVNGAGANIQTQNIRSRDNISSQYKDDNSTPKVLNIKWDTTNQRLSLGEAWVDAQLHSITDPTSAQDAATKNYVDNIGALLSANNLSDLASASTARTNLGLGSVATLSSISLTSNVTGTLPVANGGTGATTLTGILKGNGTSAFTAVTAPSGAIIGDTDTQTLTNKDIKSATNTFAAVTTITSSATPTPTGDSRENELYITAQAVAGAIAAPSGTPTNGNKLFIRIKDNGTARAITWDSAYLSSGVASLISTTVINKTHSLGFKYDSTAAKWICLAADSAGY